MRAYQSCLGRVFLVRQELALSQVMGTIGGHGIVVDPNPESPSDPSIRDQGGPFARISGRKMPGQKGSDEAHRLHAGLKSLLKYGLRDPPKTALTESTLPSGQSRCAEGDGRCLM